MKKLLLLLFLAAYGINAQGQLNERGTCNLTTPILTVSDSIICSNDSARICAPDSFVSYHWNSGDTGRCIETNYAGVSYRVTVTDANNCTAVSNSVSIEVYPMANVLIEQGDTLVYPGFMSYQWYLNDSVIPEATNSLYVATQPGYYSVLTTDSLGCVSLTSPVFITGITDLRDDEQVSIHPNPCSVTSVQLSVGSELIGSLLEMYDDEGRLVFQSEIRNPKSEIAVGGLASGVYFLRISSVNVNVARKLLKL